MEASYLGIEGLSKLVKIFEFVELKMKLDSMLPVAILAGV